MTLIHGIIQQLLDCNLGDESDYPSDGVLALIDEAFAELQTEDLAGHLYAASEGRDLDKISKILNIAAWCGDENGYTTQMTMEKWLGNGDQGQAYIALHSEVFLFKTCSEMEHVMAKVTGRFPALQDRCKHLIEQRRKLKE